MVVRKKSRDTPVGKVFRAIILVVMVINMIDMLPDDIIHKILRLKEEKEAKYLLIRSLKCFHLRREIFLFKMRKRIMRNSGIDLGVEHAVVYNLFVYKDGEII